MCHAAQVDADMGRGHDRSCCNRAFEVTGLASSCEEGFCLAVLGQTGARVPQVQARTVDAAAGRQPEAQVCVLTAHVQGPLPSASRLEVSGPQMLEVHDCAGSGQGEVQVCAEQTCLLSRQVLQAAAAETRRVQGCQESSVLCLGRGPPCHCQGRFKDGAAIDQHFFGQVFCCRHFSSVEGTECHATAGPCRELLGQVDAQEPQVQVCHAAQGEADRGRSHDWRRLPPASRASMPLGQGWCTHGAACGEGLPRSILPLEPSLPGSGAQVVQVSSMPCLSRCHFSRGQVRQEDTAAIDPRLCPSLVVSGCHCRCLPRQGQVRCTTVSVQATRKGRGSALAPSGFFRGGGRAVPNQP